MANIWVVEDDSIVAKLVIGLLIANGYSVSGFSGGQEAIHFLETGQFPDVLLLDVVMPKPDGNDVLQLVKQLGRPPVVVLTADVSMVSKELATIPVAIVAKPFKYHELMDTIKKAVG